MAVYDHAPTQQSNEVIRAHDNGFFINQAFERVRSGKIFNPIDESCATERLTGQVRDWQSEGRVVGMALGCFDAPFHPNHQRFLLECKLQGVVELYNRYYDSQTNKKWETLDVEAQRDFANAALSDGAVKLVVSLDGDERVGSSKGLNAEKGNSMRPLLGWDTRVGNVLGLSLPFSYEQDLRVPVVDAITIHDQFALPGTIHSSTPDLVAGINPDVWTLFSEAEKDINTARTDPRFSNMTVAVIDNSYTYHVTNPLTGKTFSTTSLVNRAKGVE